MTSLARTHANRLNTLQSTGPLTAVGKARASRNALKAGLFATLMVVPSTGETAEEFDAFRSKVRSGLLPSGPVERELADRVAGLLWRLRRVVRHEAAALASAAVDLPVGRDSRSRPWRAPQAEGGSRASDSCFGLSGGGDLIE